MKKIICILATIPLLFSVSCDTAPSGETSSFAETSSNLPVVADPNHYLLASYDTVEELHNSERAAIAMANEVPTVDAIDEAELNIDGYHLYKAQLWEYIEPEFYTAEEGPTYQHTSLRYLFHSEDKCPEDGSCTYTPVEDDFIIQFVYSHSEDWPLKKITGIEDADISEDNEKLYENNEGAGCSYSYLINDKTLISVVFFEKDHVMKNALCDKLVSWAEAYEQKIFATE